MINELIYNNFGTFSKNSTTNNEREFYLIESIALKSNQKLILDDSFEWNGFDFSPEGSILHF